MLKCVHKGVSLGVVPVFVHKAVSYAVVALFVNKRANLCPYWCTKVLALSSSLYFCTKAHIYNAYFAQIVSKGLANPLRAYLCTKRLSMASSP